MASSDGRRFIARILGAVRFRPRAGSCGRCVAGGHAAGDRPPRHQPRPIQADRRKRRRYAGYGAQASITSCGWQA
ncbi:MAG: hypothetical protein Kow0062_05930 [Acidobacteriota bacterium]